jgi:general secretion pathway protein I
LKNQKTDGSPATRRSPQQGFTLLEVLLAVMILALAVPAILYQFSVGMEAGGRARDATEAVLHAKEKIEELKSLVDEGAGAQSGAFDDGYTWRTRVDNYEIPEKEAGENDMLRFELVQLTVTVGWDAGGQARQVELSTLKTVKKEEKR